MRSKKTWGLFALICAIFGTTFLAIRMGLDAGASPLTFASLRFVIAGSLLSGFLFVSGKLTPRVAVSMLPRVALLSLFLTVGTFGCMFIAETRVDSGLMARLDAAGPLVTAVFAAVFLGKHFSLSHVPAFALGMAGSLLIASPAAAAEPLYLAIAAGSVVTYAAGNALYPRLFRADEDPMAVNALQMLIGGTILFIGALATEKPMFPPSAVGPLLWLIVAGSMVAHTASLILVRDAGPVFAASWLYVSPCVATVAGALVLCEAITPLGIAGTALALTGVFLLDRAERKGEASPRKGRGRTDPLPGAPE